MRKNVPIRGFILGMLLPVVGFAIVYFIMFRDTPLRSLYESMAKNHKEASKVMTLSLLINLLPFLYFMKKRLDYAMNGVVIATMLYAVFIVLVMFVW